MGFHEKCILFHSCNSIGETWRLGLGEKFVPSFNVIVFKVDGSDRERS